MKITAVEREFNLTVSEDEFANIFDGIMDSILNGYKSYLSTEKSSKSTDLPSQYLLYNQAIAPLYRMLVDMNNNSYNEYEMLLIDLVVDMAEVYIRFINGE